MPRPPENPFDRTLVEGPLPGAIWKVAWPTLLQNNLSSLQGVIDHVMVGYFVGYLGNAALGVSWQIFLAVVVFVNALYGGMGVLVARFAGAGESAKVRRVIYQILLGTAFMSVGVFAPLGYVLAPHLLDLVHAEPQVKAEALPFLRTHFLLSLGMMSFYLVSGGLRAAGDARTPLRLGLLLTALNFVLNVVLIGGMGPVPALGTRGAALGTVISGFVVAAYAFHLLFSGRLVIRLEARLGNFRPDWKVLREIFRFGLPAGFQGLAMNLGGILLIRFVGALEKSAEAQAAYSVAYVQLFAFIVWTASALHAASATLTGQNVGAGRLDRALRVPLLASAMGLWISVPLALAFLLAPRVLLGIFSVENAQVLTLGEELLAYLSLSCLLAPTAMGHLGALHGGGDTRSPLYISILSKLLLPVTFCVALQAVRGLEPADIWLALVLGHLLRCSLAIARFRQGKWRSIEVSLSS